DPGPGRPTYSARRVLFQFQQQLQRVDLRLANDIDLEEPLAQAILDVGYGLEQPQLLARPRGLAAERGLAAAAELVLFERLQDVARPRDHRLRQAGQPRHLDSIASIGPPGQDLVHEDDVVLPFARDDVRVHRARYRVGQVGQLVIVRREH